MPFLGKKRPKRRRYGNDKSRKIPVIDDVDGRSPVSLVLADAMAAGGDEAKRAFEAMMTMTKIDIAAIEAARRG